MEPTTTATPAGLLAAPDPAALQAVFPQYEIETLLGRGGMGAVYRARHRKLGRMVAIKLLLPPADDPEFAERFEREARALAQLDHPGIVKLHDVGETDDYYYLVMEFIDGANLRELMTAGTLAPSDALCWVPQICAALQFAHDAGIVHRDIKPENILIDQDGRARIADFGLAKVLGGDQPSLGLTRSHFGMGTPHYMAPEQVAGAGQVDHRADIYSLGVMLYEMLTGALPMGRFAPPSAKSAASPKLDAVVMKSLENEPDDRYQHASEVKTDVEAAQQPAAPPPVPGSAGPTHRRKTRLKRRLAKSRQAGRKRPMGEPTETASPTPAWTAPAVPWGTFANFGLILAAAFMSWGTVTGSHESMAWAGLITQEFTAWNSNMWGVPSAMIIALAAVVAILRIAKYRGHSVPPAAIIVPASYGFLHCGVMFLLLATNSNGSPGPGVILTAICMGAWSGVELAEFMRTKSHAQKARRAAQRSS